MGSILAASNTVTGTTTNQQTLFTSGQLSSTEQVNLLHPKSTIIEELANLSHRLALTLDKQTDEGPWKITSSTTPPHANTILTGIRKSKEKLMPYYQYFQRFKIGGDLKSDFMIRWGWFEDNIISKYTAATMKGGRTLFNFRSIDDKGESIKISYHENLIPINPFRSMIFADSTLFKETDLDGGDLNIENFGEDGTNDKYFDRYSKYFVDYAKLQQYTAGEFNSDGYGKLRNIYVSLSDILESFGFDPEYTKKLTTLVKTTLAKPMTVSTDTMRKRLGGGDSIKIGGKTFFGPDMPATYYANSDKIDPPKTMESAINTLLKKINRNFHNYWNFQIVTDTETVDNIRIVDSNYVAPNPNKGPEQPIDYTTDDEPGIYKFPSFTVGSNVKSQTLEFKLPDAMKTIAMYGTNSPKGGTPADSSMKKFKALGGINKNPFIKSGGVEGTHIISNLIKLSDLPRRWGRYGNTHGSGSLTKSGNDLKGENTFKYVKMVEKTVTANSSGQAELVNTFTVKNGVPEGQKYVMDVKAKNVVLKAEAVEFTRTELGLSSDDTSDNKSYLIPAELGLEIDGIGGIKPGNICHTDYIQRIYKERTIGDKGPNTFFQIFDITQKVSDDGWTTTLGTKMRLNGNALSGDLTGSFDDVLDMDFGTPMKDREKAANTTKVQAAIESAKSAEMLAEARAQGVSLGELSRPDDAEMEGDLELDELEFDDFSNLDKPPPPPVIPVITAATGNLMEFEGSAIQNNILYKARPDLRSPHPDGGWIVASKAERKKAWDLLHKRDEPESQAAIVAEVAKVETQTVVAEKSKEVKEQVDPAVAENNRKVALGNDRMNEEVNKITYKITLDTVYHRDGKYWHKVEGTYTGDLSIGGENPFENKMYKFRNRTFAPQQAKTLVLTHFSNLLKPLVKEEVGLV
jgi:hypothetical protein